MSPPPSTGELVTPRRLAVGYGTGLAVAALASWLRVGMTGTLRIDTGHVSFFVASAILGAGLLLASVCAWRLIEAAPRVPPAQLVRWGLLATLPVCAALPLTSTDVFMYLGMGLVSVAGKNPFAVPMAEVDLGALAPLIPRQWSVITSTYGPVANLASGAAAWLGVGAGAPLAVGLAAYKVLMAACAAALVLLAARHARRLGGGAASARGLALAAFCPLVAWEIVGQAHNDGLVVVALMVFATAALEEHAVVAVLALTAATCTKIALAPLLGLHLLFLLRTRGPRALAYTPLAALAGAALMVPYLRGFEGFGGMMSAIRSATRSHSLGDLLWNVLAPLGPGAQGAALTATFALCGVASLVAFAWAARAKQPAELLRGAVLFLFVWDLTVPVFQTWYVTWLIPLAVALDDERLRRVIFFYAALSVLEWTGPIDPFSTMGVNAWVIWQLVRVARAPALAPPVAAP
jgi:alpha-1,6-mannosyltransferase